MSEIDEFQHWYAAQRPDLPEPFEMVASGKRFVSMETEWAWRAWQAARAQGAEPVGFVQAYDMAMLKKGQPARIFAVGNCPSPFESYQFVYTHPPAKPEWVSAFAKRMDVELEKHDISGYEPVIKAVAEAVLATAHQPAQQGSVPAEVMGRVKNLLCSLGHQGCVFDEGEPPYDIGEWGIKEAQELHSILTAPQPKGDEWVNLVEGLAKRAESENISVEVVFDDGYTREEFDTDISEHVANWLRSLQHPQPPKQEKHQ